MPDCTHEDLITNIKTCKRLVAEDYTPASRKPKTSHASYRDTIYRGHKIRIRTSYRIEIDGEPMTVPVMVSDEGWVHCHGIPNYAAPSALDLVRRIIDTTPAELPPDEIGPLLQEAANKEGGS